MLRQRARVVMVVPCLAFAVACGSSDPGASEDNSEGASGSPAVAGGTGGTVEGSGGTSSASGGSSAGAGQASGVGGAGGTNNGASGGSGKGGAGGSAGVGGSVGVGGSGGAGGSAGGPPAVVGTCEKLGAAGTWELITPPTAKNTQALVMDPFNIGTLWLGASPRGNAGSGQGGLFRSTDCGATWTHVNSGTNGTKIDTASLWSIAVDPVTPGVIYVIGQYGPQGLWKSTNGGVDWTQLMPPGSAVANAANAGGTPSLAGIGSVSMDPKNHLHLVVGTHANCTGEYAPACGAETTDGGETWTIFKTSFMTGWAEQTGPYVIDANTWVYAMLFGGLWLTTDRGASWKNVAPPMVNGVTGGEYTHRPIWQGSDGTYYLPAYNKVASEQHRWPNLDVAPRFARRFLRARLRGRRRARVHGRSQWPHLQHVVRRQTNHVDSVAEIAGCGERRCGVHGVRRQAPRALLLELRGWAVADGDALARLRRRSL